MCVRACVCWVCVYTPLFGVCQLFSDVVALVPVLLSLQQREEGLTPTAPMVHAGDHTTRGEACHALHSTRNVCTTHAEVWAVDSTAVPGNRTDSPIEVDTKQGGPQRWSPLLGLVTLDFEALIACHLPVIADIHTHLRKLLANTCNGRPSFPDKILPLFSDCYVHIH